MSTRMHTCIILGGGWENTNHVEHVATLTRHAIGLAFKTIVTLLSDHLCQNLLLEQGVIDFMSSYGFNDIIMTKIMTSFMDKAADTTK